MCCHLLQEYAVGEISFVTKFCSFCIKIDSIGIGYCFSTSIGFKMVNVFFNSFTCVAVTNSKTKGNERNDSPVAVKYLQK